LGVAVSPQRWENIVEAKNSVKRQMQGSAIGRVEINGHGKHLAGCFPRRLVSSCGIDSLSKIAPPQVPLRALA
jgi:hypothetical protein